MSCIVLDIELNDKNVIKELGLFIDGSVQGFSFCPPKTFKLIKQTSWNTKHLHGIAWSSGKLDYEKVFAVFYDIKVMNAEVFAKGFEKCGLLSTLLGQNVQNMDDYGCPKIQDYVVLGKCPDSFGRFSWSKFDSNYLDVKLQERRQQRHSFAWSKILQRERQISTKSCD